MSNYTKTTDFEAKDSLPSGDSGKIIRGSEFETEFDNIATAIASKSDANNPTFTGTVTIDGLTVNGNTVLGNAASDTVTVTADIASNLLPSADDTYNLGAVGAEWNDLHVDGVAYIDTINGFAATGDVNFGDNNKAQFGAGNDLQIFHDGSNSRIKDNGTGGLYVQGSSFISLTNASATETYVYAAENGAVQLKYDNATKLATTNTGIDVTGTVTADGLTVYKSGSGDAEVVIRPSDSSGDPVLKLKENSASTRLTIRSDESDGAKVKFQTGNTEVTRLAFGQSGDISFYEDTGTTPKFYWDASAERLGLGTTSPSATLHAKSSSTEVARVESTGTTGSYLTFKNADTTVGQKAWIGADGDLFKFYSNNSTLNMTMTTNGSVGIGTSSPSALLEVATPLSGSTAVFNLKDNTADGFVIKQGSNEYISVDTTNAAEVITLGSTTTIADVIVPAGNVGIGTDNPGRMLHLNGSSPAIRLQDTDLSGYAEISANQTNSGITFNADPTNAQANTLFAFKLDGSERMRITSGGHLLVGKTSQDQTNTVGFEAKDIGQTVVTTDNSQSLILNRKTADGTVAEFRKDNTVVGSIKSRAGTVLSVILDPRTGGAGFTGELGGIRPTDQTGDITDNAIDLGKSTGRFKDLYLSGGAYLGGVAAANKLDDYEEGTWTPVYVSSGGSFATMAMDVQSATYTKIGNLVTINCFIRTDDVDITGASGSVKIDGLPFSAASQASTHSNYATGWDTDGNPSGGYISGSSVFLQKRTDINNPTNSVAIGDLSNGTVANANQLILSATYRTTA